MRFLGIAESITPMGVLLARLRGYKLGPGYRLLTTSRLPGDPVRGPRSPSALESRGPSGPDQAKGRAGGARPGHHRLDEFRPAIPRSGCSPAEPVSASPVTIRIIYCRIERKDLSSNGSHALTERLSSRAHPRLTALESSCTLLLRTTFLSSR